MRAYRVQWWRVQWMFARPIYSRTVHHDGGAVLCRNWKWAHRAHLNRR